MSHSTLLNFVYMVHIISSVPLIVLKNFKVISSYQSIPYSFLYGFRVGN